MGHKREKPEVKEDISPNLIPMIDIMFLLLLFFMLGADMGQREKEELILPNADKVKEEDKARHQGEFLTTINIHHSPDKGVVCPIADNGGICRDESHWKWAISGHDYNKDTIKPQLQILADLNLQSAPDPIAKKKLSERKVLIRADKDAPYGDVQKVIEYCGVAGMYKIEIGAAKPAPEKKK
jgi:biopolymer transport protein ExbD